MTPELHRTAVQEVNAEIADLERMREELTDRIQDLQTVVRWHTLRANQTPVCPPEKHAPAIPTALPNGKAVALPEGQEQNDGVKPYARMKMKDAAAHAIRNAPNKRMTTP